MKYNNDAVAKLKQPAFNSFNDIRMAYWNIRCSIHYIHNIAVMSQKQMTYIQEATILHIPKQNIKLKWEKNFIGFL